MHVNITEAGEKQTMAQYTHALSDGSTVHKDYFVTKALNDLIKGFTHENSKAMMLNGKYCASNSLKPCVFLSISASHFI